MTGGSPISRFALRPASRPIARVLARTPATPNLATSLALLGGLAAGAMLAAGWQVAGGAIIAAVAVFDAVDGELTGLKRTVSRFRPVFDAVADRSADAAILGGMTVHAARFEDWPQPEAVGLAALAGALTVAYASARVEASLGDLAAGSSWLGERDLLLGIAAAGAVLGQCYWTLAIVGVTSALTVTWRLAYLRLRRVGVDP